MGLLAGTCAAHVASRSDHASFSSWSPQGPPLRVIGDFDGDGRVDTAFIQDPEGDRRISIRLSASSAVIQLQSSVIGLVESDIDHDGDLDLVASTLSGDILIWLNDGRGRFTRQPASTAPGLSAEAVLVQSAWPDVLAIGVNVPIMHSPGGTYANVVITKARPPSVPLAPATHSPTLPSLRAPPALTV